MGLELVCVMSVRDFVCNKRQTLRLRIFNCDLHLARNVAVYHNLWYSPTKNIMFTFM